MIYLLIFLAVVVIVLTAGFQINFFLSLLMTLGIPTLLIAFVSLGGKFGEKLKASHEKPNDDWLNQKSTKQLEAEAYEKRRAEAKKEYDELVRIREHNRKVEEEWAKQQREDPEGWAEAEQEAEEYNQRHRDMVKQQEEQERQQREHEERLYEMKQQHEKQMKEMKEQQEAAEKKAKRQAEEMKRQADRDADDRRRQAEETAKKEAKKQAEEMKRQAEEAKSREAAHTIATVGQEGSYIKVTMMNGGVKYVLQGWTLQGWTGKTVTARRKSFTNARVWYADTGTEKEVP